MRTSLAGREMNGSKPSITEKQRTQRSLAAFSLCEESSEIMNFFFFHGIIICGCPEYIMCWASSSYAVMVMMMLLSISLQIEQASQERSKKGSRTTICNPNTQWGWDHGRWLQVEKVWTESCEEQSSPSVNKLIFFFPPSLSEKGKKRIMITSTQPPHSSFCF